MTEFSIPLAKSIVHFRVRVRQSIGNMIYVPVYKVCDPTISLI